MSQATDKDSVDYYLAQSKIYFYNDFKKAEVFIKKAEKISKKSADGMLAADVAYYYGSGNYLTGSYDVAMTKYLEAYTIYEKFNNKEGIAKSLIGQGLVQQGIGHNKEAIEFFRKSLEICKETGNDLLASKNYLNIGISESELNQNPQAYKNFQTALRLAIKNEDADLQHMSINRLGNVHYLLGNQDSAIFYYKKLINEHQDANLWEKAFANTGISEVLLKKGNYQDAEIHALKGYQFAQQLDAKWDIVRAAKVVSDVYKSAGKFNDAYNYLNISSTYRDSLFNEEKLKEINLIQLKQKEAENEKLLAINDAAKQKLTNTRLFAVSVILFMLYLLTILYQHNKNGRQKEMLYRELELKNLDIENQKALIIGQNQVLGEVNQTKNRLFSIFSHDMKAPINSIQQVLEMVKEGDISTEELQSLVALLVEQISGTSAMMNNVLQWSMTQLDGAKISPEPVDVTSIISDSIAALQISAKGKEILINFEKDENPPIVFADRGHVQIILNNLFSNAIKFTPFKGKIEVRFSVEDSNVNIHILNSGKDLSQKKIDEMLDFDKRMLSEKGTGQEEGTGLGLLLVKQFLSDNNGKFNVELRPEVGTEFTITFPKYDSAK